MHSLNGNGFSDGKVDIEHMMIVDIEDMELP